MNAMVVISIIVVAILIILSLIIFKFTKEQTMSVSPITPDQVEEVKLSLIPDFVIEAVNQLIVDNWLAGSKKAIVKQKDIIVECTISGVWNHDWLDFEPLYRKKGWVVNYEKPDYDENWDAFFAFIKE